MSLYETALQNAHLKFIDGDTDGPVRTLSDIAVVNFDSDQKELLFAYLDNSIESVGLFWSVMKSRHCIALLSPALGQHFKEELEAIYKPRFIYDKTRDELAGYTKTSDHEVSYFVSEETAGYAIDEKVKVLISTSGTTGSPKFVKLSDENLLANAVSITQYLPIDGNESVPLNLPIYYSYGLSVLTSNAIKGGNIICSNDDVLKKDFWEKFKRYGYTSIAGVPFVYEMLDRIGFTKTNYPSLKYFTQAGGKLQEKLVRKYGEYAEANNVRFFVMYGQTEATARMSYLPPDMVLTKLGSIGKPIPGGEFELDEETSELCYRGANIFGGYATSGEDLAAYEQPQMLRTGDIARADEDGFYYITGRLKRFAKIFGVRVNLDEIESLIANHLHIPAKCTSFEDKQLLIFTNQPEVNLKDIAQFLSTELKIHISVIKTFCLEEYPLTANGKVNYTELIKSYAVA